MNRRDLIVLLGSAAAAWPAGTRAQQFALPVIGFLNSDSADQLPDRLRAFRQGLSETGYVEGRNVTIEYRWADGQYDRLPALAADLVQRQVTVVAAAPSTAAQAAKAATATIPVVFRVGVDPVEMGLVTSLNRPSGNVTGVTNLNVELGPKRLELLHELVPTARTIAALINPSNPTADSQSRQLRAAAGRLGLELQVLHAGTMQELDTVFSALAHSRIGALLIGSDGFFGSRNEQLAALALRHHTPAIYAYREFAVSGGLLSYGGSSTDSYRQFGVYAGQILKGAKPADLPVQQAVKVELVINLKTARSLNVSVPLSLLGRANEVIE